MQPDYHRVERLLVNAVWLVRLRWVAVFGQFMTIGAVAFLLDIELPLGPLFAIVGLTAVTNAGFSFWLANSVRAKRSMIQSDRITHGIVAVIVLDLISLTVLLAFSGGLANPFTIFYFVNLALAAVILPARWGWMLGGIAVVCLTLLLFAYKPLPALEQQLAETTAPRAVRLRDFGLIPALAACAGVVIYFVTRVTRELRQRERELRIAEQQRADSQRLEALGTLAAGAGHELATPLSTIAVVTKELTRHLEGVNAPSTVIEDVALIRSELNRCRSILDRMAGGVGQFEAEPWDTVTVKELLDEVLDELGQQERVRVDYDAKVEQLSMSLPLQTTAQAIRGVVQNGLDASADQDIVHIRASEEDRHVCLRISDQGPGMPTDVLSRAGEPFYTTKEPGGGMGLGLFLTRSVMNRLGGTLEIQSAAGEGVTAIVRIPTM